MLVCVASAGLVAACSSESTPASPGAPTSSAQQSTGAKTTPAQTATGPLDQYLLRASDLPTGYAEITIPKDQMGSATDSLLASTKNATVSPAACQPDLSGVSADAVNKAAASYFSNGSNGDLVGSVAVADRGYVDTYRKYNLGSCATHDVTSSLNGQTFSATVTTKKIDVATPGIDGALVIQQDVATQVPGSGEIKQTSLLAVLPAKNGTVSVTLKNILGTSAPNQSAFASIVAAASKRANG